MKTLKRVGLGALSLLALLVLGVTAKFYLLAPVMRPAPDVKAPNTPEAIARGKYLATGVAMCIGCHSPSDSDVPGQPVRVGTEFEGRDFIEITDFPGHLRAPNLTADVETGIGGHTDGEVLRALREGVGSDGHALFMMPSGDNAAAMSDDDALAIIAYLRTLPAKHNVVPRLEVGFPLSMLLRSAPKPITTAIAPMPADPLQRGQRLLKLAHCAACHSTHGEHHQDLPGLEYAGGDKFASPDGQHVVYAPNLTGDRETGIGGFTDDQLRRALTNGLGHDDRMLYFMPWTLFAQLTPGDLDAVIVALRTIPAVRHAVPAPSSGPVKAAAR